MGGRKTTGLSSEAVQASRRHALSGLIAAAALAFAIGGATAQITAPNDHLIVPGERVGPFALGMTEAQLIALGKPSIREAMYVTYMDSSNKPVSHPAAHYVYFDEHVGVVVDQTISKVVQIEVGDSGDCRSYKTADGITCDVTYQQLTASLAMGSPDITLTQYNDFSRKLEVVGFRAESGSGATTRAAFVEHNATEASPTYDTVQRFLISASGVASW